MAFGLLIGAVKASRQEKQANGATLKVMKFIYKTLTFSGSFPFLVVVEISLHKGYTALIETKRALFLF